jgi:hypothetical protein
MPVSSMHKTSRAMMAPIVCATMLFGLSVANAQTAEEMFQSAANAAGKSCLRVTAIHPFATDTAGNAFVGVACAGGETYVFQIDADSQTVDYHSPCSTFEVITGTPCF